MAYYITREEVIEQLEYTVLLIKQDGKDWWDERDIPILEYAIEHLKQEPVLDKIGTEIRKKMKFNSFNEGYVLYDDITEVFDKYKAKNEE